LLLCCNSDGRAQRWAVPTLEPMNEANTLPIGVTSLAGCLLGTGCFAALYGSDSSSSEAPGGRASIALVAADGSSRCVELPVDAKFATGQLAALWCGATLAVVMIACEPNCVVAVSVSTESEELFASQVLTLPSAPIGQASFGHVARMAKLPNSMFDAVP
jgi:hypothetical protein